MKVATLDDLSEIADMSMAFVDSTGYKDFSNRETIESLIAGIVTSDPTERIIIFESGVGFLAGCATPFIFGPHRLATEIAWWVNSDFRGKGVGGEFLKAFEYWAKEKANCTMISMVAITDGLGDYYYEQGYKLYERAYMKVL